MITINQPLWQLSVGEFISLLKENGISSEVAIELKPQHQSKTYVYGLRGIKELFNVSHATAQKYKDTFLRPAIIQNGRKLVVDADEAIRLFKQAGKGNSYGK